MIEKAIRSLLQQAVNAAGYSANRTFPMLAPAETEYPFFVYQKISGARDHHLEGASGLAFPRIQIDAYATTYAAAKALFDQARRVLDGFRGTVAGVEIKSCLLDTERDLPAEERSPADSAIFRVSGDFLLIHAETVG